MSIPSTPLRWCGILATLFALGCGRDDKLTPVHGQVFYRDQPLAGGTIVFAPDPERGGRGPLACGEIGSDGRYFLQPGAVAGWYRITIASALIAGSPAPDFPRKYSDPEQSGLRREIHAVQPDEQNFHLD